MWVAERNTSRLSQPVTRRPGRDGRPLTRDVKPGKVGVDRASSHALFRGEVRRVRIVSRVESARRGLLPFTAKGGNEVVVTLPLEKTDFVKLSIDLIVGD